MRFMLSGLGFAAIMLTGTVALAGASQEVRGEITSVSASAHTLVVKEATGPRAELHLTLDDAAKVMSAGKPATIADLSAGERVKVSYTGEGAARAATRVEILPAKAAPRS
jgi:hypothetical protein